MAMVRKTTILTGMILRAFCWSAGVVHVCVCVGEFLGSPTKVSWRIQKVLIIWKICHAFILIGFELNTCEIYQSHCGVPQRLS